MGNSLGCMDDYTIDAVQYANMQSPAVRPHPVGLHSHRHALVPAQSTRPSSGQAVQCPTAERRHVVRLPYDPAVSPDDYRRKAESHRERAQFHTQHSDDALRSVNLPSSAVQPHLSSGQAAQCPTAERRHVVRLTYDPAVSPEEYRREAESHRERAQFHTQQRDDFSERSQAAFMANDRSLAKRLSDARKNEQRLLEQEYALAASAFFHANNARRKMNQIDLHDLSVPEALEYLMERIDTCKAARTKLLTAIVGRGNNSRGRVPVLGRKIKHHLQEKGFVVTNHESNPGCIVVQLCDDAGQTQTAEVPAESQSPPILAPTTQLGVVNPVLQTAPTTTADERRRVAGRQHGRRARQGTKQQLVQNALAADEGNNARRDISDVDLHGVTVNEADTSVMRRIEERKKAGVDHLAVITGSDMRSERGGTFEVGGPPALQRKGPSLPNRIDPDPHRHRRPHQPRCNEGGERRRRRCRRKRGDQGGCPAPLHPRLADQPPRTE